MAVVPYVPGAIDYSSEGSSRYTKEIYANAFLKKYFASTCLTMIANQDVANIKELKGHGDTAIIRTRVSPTIKPYTRMGVLEPEQTESPPVTVKIDDGAYWFSVQDKVDVHQNDVDYIPQMQEDAAKNIKIYQETKIFSNLYTFAHAKNKGNNAGVKYGNYKLGTTGSPVVLNEANIVSRIVDCRSVLNEQNINPEERCYMVIPEVVYNTLLGSDLKNAMFTGDTSTAIYGNFGLVGKNIRGFDLYISNNTPTVTDGTLIVFPIIFGHSEGLALVNQIQDIEYFDKFERMYAKGVRTIMVWGFKVVIPEALGTLYAVVEKV